MECSSVACEEVCSSSRESALIQERNVPSARLLSIKFEMMTSVEMEKYSNFIVVETSDLTKPKLGLPNPLGECSTCGGANTKQCDGHVGIIKFSTTIFHPYFVQEIVQILNKICPGCKSLSENLQTKSTISPNQGLLEDQPTCKYCSGHSHGCYPAMKFKLLKDKSNRGSITVEVNEKVPKRFKDKHLGIALPKDYWDFIPNGARLEGFPGVEKVLLTPSQVFYLLKELDREFIEQYVVRRELLFLSCFPVTPNCNRITEINIGSGSPKVIFDDRTRAYKKLVDSNRKVDEIQRQHHSSAVLTTRVLECLSFSKLHHTSSSSGDTASSVSGLRWIKDVVLCKRTDFACRMTVVGDPNVGLCEIGVPEEIASQLFVPDSITFLNQDMWNSICNKHLQHRDIYVKRNNRKIIPCYPVELQIGDVLCISQGGGGLVYMNITSHNQCVWNRICNMHTQYQKLYVRRKAKLLSLCYPVELQIGDILYRPLEDGDLLLVNRPPSVHQHSLIALSAKILPTESVFSINPLCCAPFSGDFDGDCLHAYVPQSIHSKVELRELVYLDKQLLNGQDGRSLISLSQDSLTASHLLTGDMVFLSSHEMQQLHMSFSCLLQQPAIIKAPFLTAPLWTGQQLFSSILPQNLDFSVASKMIHISKGEVLVSPMESSWLQNTVDGLFTRISKCCGGKALEYFCLAQEVLSEWISTRGFSVSLGDIYISSNAYDRAKLIQEVDYGMQEAEHASYVKKLMMDPEMGRFLKDYNGREDLSCITNDEIDSTIYCKHRILNQQSFAAFKEVLNELQYVVREYARKGNSMLSMIHSGSKGTLLKLLHQGVCLGLQHSKTFLSFRMPPILSCAMWNQYKVSNLRGMVQDTTDYIERHSSYAVIRSSFLDGLNPFECFLHSLSGRMNLFSENAQFPGTLTRKLMFYMRDLYFAYDGSVRNSYGQQVIQFDYNVAGRTSIQNVYCEREVQPGQPIGALAACSVSEAAYSALDLASSTVEISPLVKLKNLLECGHKSTVSQQTMSLALSKKLKRWDYGFEYAALAVQKHLQRVLLSDIVSTVLIFYAGQDAKMGTSPWIMHFHVNKENLLKHRLKLKSIVDVLNREYRLIGEKLNTTIPKLHISSRHCSLDDMHKEQDMENCIIVAGENCEFPVDLDCIQETVIPVLLGTVVKGFLEVKRVDILWNDQYSPGFCEGSSGLFLKVFLSENCEGGQGWTLIQNACIPVMDLIDWECSHPDNIYDISEAYGIDAAWKYFLGNLKATTSNIGKKIHTEYLHLVANCLSVTGKFHPLNAKGIKLQRDQLSISSPFMQGFFSIPEKNFINAAKQENVDQLLGTVDAMAWGKEAPLGTGGPFKLLYSGKMRNLCRLGNVYESLKNQCVDQQADINVKMLPHHHLFKKEDSKLTYAYDFLRSEVPDGQIEMNRYVGCKSIPLFTHLVTSLRNILQQYPMDAYLKEEDKSLVAMALTFHPRRDAKIGIGIKDIKIGCNPRFPESRCYILERMDGTSDDFSYRKCIKGAFDQCSLSRFEGQSDMRTLCENQDC